MVPFAGPPATLQVTAVLEVPVTVAVNCTVLPTATLTLAGLTDTATCVLFEVPAQPSNKTESKLKPLTKNAKRMAILTGGRDSYCPKLNSRGGQHLPMELDYKAG